jgi:hypothetical protein
MGLRIFSILSLTDIFSWIEPPLSSHQHLALHASSYCPFPPFFPTSQGKHESFQLKLGGTDTEHEGAPAKNGASPVVRLP